MPDDNTGKVKQYSKTDVVPIIAFRKCETDDECSEMVIRGGKDDGKVIAVTTDSLKAAMRNYLGLST